MTVGALFVLFLVLGVGGGLLLYALVRAEHSKRTTMDRSDAEQAARRDTPERDDQ